MLFSITVEITREDDEPLTPDMVDQIKSDLIANISDGVNPYTEYDEDNESETDIEFVVSDDIHVTVTRH